MDTLTRRKTFIAIAQHRQRLRVKRQHEESEQPWLAEALAQAQANRDPQGLPVLPLPYLALMKLQAGRVQDLADVARMLGQASEDALAQVRQLFHRYAAEDMEDLESLITLGKLETQQ